MNFRRCIIVAFAWLGGTVALAQNAQVSGRVREEGSGRPIANAQVRIEGPALASRENSQLIRKVNPMGGYQLEVPPGAYQVWVLAPNFEEAVLKLDLAPGAVEERTFTLTASERSRAYRVETLSLPRQMIPEISGIAFTPRGSLVVTNRRGEVWIRAIEDDRWRRFAYGLYEGFGVVANSETDVLVVQRPELTRLRDTDGDGEADVYQTVADQWGITGNYHEFTYGLARDASGNVFFGSGMVSYGQGRELPWVRGPARKELYLPWTGQGPVPDGHRSIAQYQGWLLRVSADGTFTPFASGFRQPLGIGVSPQNDVFVTDVSGAWVPTSTLLHVEQDGFYGHPDPLKWHPEFSSRTLTIDALRRMRRPPAAYLPRGLMGTSPGQPVWDTTGGKFGPFTGQMFIGDVTNLLMRVDLEKVAGAYQGAAFPFLRGQGLRLGGMHHAFGPDGALYIAQTVRGWMSTEGNEGIQRVVFTGEEPVEIQSLRLTDVGFALRFTSPMTSSAAVAEHYAVKRFQYDFHPLDGSLRRQEAEVPVVAVRLAADGQGVELDLLELQPAFVYEVTVSERVVSTAGQALFNRTAYYTANRLRSGVSEPGPSRIIAKAAVLSAPDPKRGAEIFRLNCVACHQADGRGSAQIGTPDYTAANSPLRKPDAELLAVIVEGRVQSDGKMMPPFGNVLSPQAIHDVLAYLREAFLRPRADPPAAEPGR